MSTFTKKGYLLKEAPPEMPTPVHIVLLQDDGITWLNKCGAPVAPGYGHPECFVPGVGWPYIVENGACPTCFRPVCEGCHS